MFYLSRAYFWILFINGTTFGAGTYVFKLFQTAFVWIDKFLAFSWHGEDLGSASQLHVQDAPITCSFIQLEQWFARSKHHKGEILLFVNFYTWLQNARDDRICKEVLAKFTNQMILTEFDRFPLSFVVSWIHGAWIFPNRVPRYNGVDPFVCMTKNLTNSRVWVSNALTCLIIGFFHTI